MTTITRQESVQRAVEFRGPDRVPIVFWNRDQSEGDVMLYVEEYGVMGMSAENYRACGEAFRRLGG
jgi:hypothetical protein